MKMPKPTAASIGVFETLVADDPRLEVRKLFGCPTAFANGNMCLGAFGPDVYLRLSDADMKRAQALPGTRPFEPMAGRAMREYLILPMTVLSDPKQSRLWVERSVAYTRSLPPKKRKTTR